LEVGLPVNSSIFATNSIFGTLFAILLLDETPTIGLWTGIVCVVIGVSTIQGSMDTTAFRSRKLVKHGLLVPLIASVFAGLGYALKKVALNVYNEPLIGVTVAYSADLVFYAIVFVLSPRIRDAAPINSHTSRLFWKGGFFIALGTFLGFYAIKSGNVAVVMPLLQIEPLFVLFITYLFLRKVETLSKKLVFGTLIIVTGVILVTAFRG
jgi:drug/metabolite transporter (DMT)-like permease